MLDEHFTKLGEAIGKPEYARIRPLDIIVLTDGRPGKPWTIRSRRTPNLFFPDQAPAIKDVLAAAVKRMKEAKHHPNTVGVQFVQIGDDQKAKKALQKIVYSENGVRYILPLFVCTTDEEIEFSTWLTQSYIQKN